MKNSFDEESSLGQMHVFSKLKPGPEVIKKVMFNSAEHEIFLLKNVKMPTIVGIFTFISRKNRIFVLSEPEKKS